MPDYGDDPVWGHVHPVVGHLLRQHELQPRGLRGFPVLPRLGMNGSAQVALWLAERGRPWVSTAARAAYDADLQTIRSALDAEHRVFWSARSPEREDEVRALQGRRANRAAVAQIAARRRPDGVEGLAGAAAGALQAASYSVQGVLVAMVTRLGRAAGDERVPSLATDLEDEILRAECQSATDAYLEEPIRVERVLWRGPQGTKPAGHFLFATTAGFGVVTKLKNRWAAVTGGRDEVLATLPDSWFPEATAGFFAEV